ncbi:HTH-type transcriptional activator Btr [Paenibacillus sp. CECT 9249]|uniref:helix-turn-helix domain-containing protein n=1 Tax=Paenibacillus sp. CECT 9249 TaxID=2845385 RepID=UPI001E3998DA|nr:helix-turn-helix domain-containing protein [Paenibacillus sp. CECT 9249]CAH0117699.1 HTH-type transcriptional activator Btr [Paenibacillus sp. CECT 9249]
MFTEEETLTDNNLYAPDRNRKTNLNDVKEFMDKHYNEPLSIGSLAQMANISPKYFVDLFKETYGQSAMEYLTDLRMNRAKRYLAETDERLREIAIKVGYRDEFYFSRKFKKEVGLAPSDYAKNFRRRIAANSPSMIGHLLALHVIPAAAPLHPKWTPYYYHVYHTKIKSHLKLTFPYTDRTFEANLDQLSQDRPDAIIGTDGLSPMERAKLEDIASCLLVPTDVDWREQLRMTARFLHKEDRAEQWIGQYDRKVLAARTQIGEAMGYDNILLLRIYRQDIHLYENRGLEEVLYRDLKLKPACRTDGGPCNAPLAPERLAELNPDRILVVVCPEASSRRFWLALQHSPEWRQLQAVNNGHVYPISADPWFEYSATAIARMLDEALLLFTGKCPNAFPENVHGKSCDA